MATLNKLGIEISDLGCKNIPAVFVKMNAAPMTPISNCGRKPQAVIRLVWATDSGMLADERR